MSVSRVKPSEGMQVVRLAVLLNIIYFLPIFLRGIDNLGYVDSDYHFYLVEAVRKSIFEYGQLPMWDPWHMGGMPLMGNPESIISPLYFPVLFFGTVVGVKVSMLLLQIAGFLGAYFLARHLKLNHIGGLIVSAVWAFNGMHSLNILAGWFWFSHLHLMPWVFLCFFVGKDDLRYAVPLGFLFSLFLFGGFPYAYVIIFTALGVVALFVSVKERNIRPVLLIAIAVFLSLLFASVRVIPSSEWVFAHPRELYKYGVVDGYSVSAFFLSMFESGISLTYPSENLFRFGSLPKTHFYMAPEYGIYIGPVAFALAIVGAVVRFPYRGALLGALGLLFLFVLGDYSPLPLASALKSLPIYDSMRVFLRFKWPMLMIISLLAGFGAVRLTERFRKRNLLGWGLFVILLVNFYAVSQPVLYDSFKVDSSKVLLPLNSEGGFYQIQTPGKYNLIGWTKKPVRDTESSALPMYPYITQNIGVTAGMESYKVDVFARGRGSPEYKGEVFFVTPEGFLPARIDKWTPNRVTVGWDAGVSGDLYLNQNFSKGWSVCDASGLKVAESGLIRVPISSGDSKVTLCYSPVGVYVGLFVSAISIAVGIWYLFYAFGWGRNRKEAEGS